MIDMSCIVVDSHNVDLVVVIDWKNGFCRDCHLKKNSFNNSKGCYHTSVPLCCETYCTIN